MSRRANDFGRISPAVRAIATVRVGAAGQLFTGGSAIVHSFWFTREADRKPS
jgi:hypothetical protein